MKRETLHELAMAWFGLFSLYYCLKGNTEWIIFQAVVFLLGYSLANVLLWLPDLIAKLNRE